MPNQSQSIADTMGPIYHREAQMREADRLEWQYPICAICNRARVTRPIGNTGRAKCPRCDSEVIFGE